MCDLLFTKTGEEGVLKTGKTSCIWRQYTRKTRFWKIRREDKTDACQISIDIFFHKTLSFYAHNIRKYCMSDLWFRDQGWLSWEHVKSSTFFISFTWAYSLISRPLPGFLSLDNILFHFLYMINSCSPRHIKLWTLLPNCADVTAYILY